MRLTTQAMMDGALQEHRLRDLIPRVDVLLELRDLHEKVKVFEATVWFPRLQAVINKTHHRGMSGNCRGITLMTWCCAGRCLIQLERGNHRLTLITADDEQPWQRDTAHVAPGMGPMGIQSIEADALEALKMLYEVTRYASEITLTDVVIVSIG